MTGFAFTEAERNVFRKKEFMPLSAWARENLIVCDGPYAGSRYRPEVNPYLAPIMDCWSDPSVEEVVISGSAQTGKTLVLHAALCYSIDRRPGPRMLAMQDDDAIGKVLQGKLLPMLRRCGGVRDMLGKVRRSRIAFADGTSLYLASAQSSGQRASISIQDLFLDEEALYKQLEGQGVPVEEFRERTRSYSFKRKILRVSKPIGGEECTILQALEDCDEVRDFWAKCPACGERQPMAESQLCLLDGSVKDPREVERRRLGRYRCACCGYLWSDRMRNAAVSAGSWRPRQPVSRPRRVGYHLPAVLSAQVSISEVMAAKMRAEATQSPAERRQYDNGIWARAYKDVMVETSEAQILEMRDASLPPRTVPKTARAVTVGIDTQARGFWYVAIAWNEDLSGTVIDYGRLPDFAAVDALLAGRWPVEDGDASLGVWRAGMDSGGTRVGDEYLSRTEEVYRFVRQNGGSTLFACKGLSRASYVPVRAVSIDRFPTSHLRIPGGLWLYLLDTADFKTRLFQKLRHDAAAPLRLHAGAEESFARQMTAEVLERGKNGKMEWKRLRKDNHYIDCCMMALACVDGSWMPSFEAILAAEKKGAGA